MWVAAMFALLCFDGDCVGVRVGVGVRRGLRSAGFEAVEEGWITLLPHRLLFKDKLFGLSRLPLS